jgi:hypothetical protein
MNKRQLTIGIVAASLTFVLGVAAAALLLTLRPLALPEIKAPDTRTPVPAPAAAKVAPQPAREIEEEEEEEYAPPVSRARLPEGHLLEVGIFHGDEVKAWTGEKWLGLFVTKGSRSTLARAKLKVERDTNETTEKIVSVKRRPKPVFLVKGASTMRPGPALTIFYQDEPVFLGHGTDMELKLGAKVYRLKVSGNGENSVEAITRDDAKLVLAAGGTEQALYDLGGKGGPMEAYWHLVWAGDADGDGKLDLYVDVSSHYNVSIRKLFLSSQAEGGELVREEAEWGTVGC